MSIELTQIALEPIELTPITLEPIGVDLRAALIAALFGEGEAGALYERSTVSDFSATHPDLSGNGADATLAGDTYSVTLPDLGTDATVAYATPESIVIVDGQTVSGATALNDRWLKYVILDRALTAEERSTLIEWMGADGATEPDFFVDSVNGNDGNAGTEADAAFATLSAAETAALAHGNGVHVALVAGSEWRESIDLSTLTGAKVTGIGTLINDGLPVVRGDDVITGDWDDSTDRADAHTNVYSQVLTWDGGAKTFPSAWENDQRLVAASSLANCNSTAGSFWTSNGVSEGASGAAATLYIHPSGSTNPDSDGKNYEFAKRKYCVYLGDTARASVLWTRRQAHSDGSFLSGSSSEVNGVISEDGVKHESLVASGSYKYCVGWHPFDDPRTNGIIMEFYKSDGSGLYCRYEKCIVVGPGLDAAQAVSGFSGHNSGVGTEYDSIDFVDCSADGLVTAAGGEADTSSMVRFHARNTKGIFGVVVRSGIETQLLDTWWDVTTVVAGLRGVQLAQSPVRYTGLRCYIGPGVGVNAIHFSPQDFLIENSVVVFDSTAINPLIFNNESGGTVVNVQQSIFQTNNASAFLWSWTTPGAGVIGDLANNVYFADSTVWLATVDGTTYNNAAAYLAAFPETGTVTIDPQLTDPANGDFTAQASGLPANCGLERPNIEYTPIPASLAAAETWIIKNAE